MEYLKLIKEILAVLSVTPLPTIILIAGLAFLITSLAVIKLKPFEIKPRRKIINTPLVIGAVLVAIAVLLYSFTPVLPPTGGTPTTTPTQTEPAEPAEPVVSTPTVFPSPTPVVTASPTATDTPTPTIEPSPTPTETPLPPTPTPTPTPVIIFQENFTDNQHRWQLISQPGDSQAPGIETIIYGGKLVVSVDCPAAYRSITCNVNIPVPRVTIQDFHMEIETSVKRRTDEANTIIGVQFRRTDANYYWFQYKEYGAFLFSLILKGKALSLADETLDSSINTYRGAVNKIGVYAKGSDYILSANGSELIRVEDGNINQPGDLYIKFHVARNNSATFEVDNLIIRDVP
jgi:hypothetical protein